RLRPDPAGRGGPGPWHHRRRGADLHRPGAKLLMRAPVLSSALCLALLLPGAALAQEDDRGYLTAFLEDNLSGAGRKVTITGFAGALSSRATITKLEIADVAVIWFTLDGVVLYWYLITLRYLTVTDTVTS